MSDFFSARLDETMKAQRDALVKDLEPLVKGDTALLRFLLHEEVKRRKLTIGKAEKASKKP